MEIEVTIMRMTEKAYLVEIPQEGGKPLEE